VDSSRARGVRRLSAGNRSRVAVDDRTFAYSVERVVSDDLFVVSGLK